VEEWKSYDQSHNCWVHRDVLMADVPAFVGFRHTVVDLQVARSAAKARYC